MEVNIDGLIPYERIATDVDAVFRAVDRNGKVVLLRDNQPAYIILKYDPNIVISEPLFLRPTANYTLHEAMRIVLMETSSKTMHVSDLADEIYRRRLYLKKDGGKAEYTQLRARVSHYPSVFSPLPGNIITLKE
ncbi:MAG: hypothetical protein Q8N36_01055 [bacterium]|nr:hypothetical protein [bacterium]